MPPRLDRLYQGALLVTVAAFSAGYAVLGLVLILVAVIAEAFLTKKLHWPRTRLDVLVGGFVAVMLLSGWFSAHRAIAVGSAGLAALAVYLSYGAVCRLLQRRPQGLERLLWAWTLGGMATGVWGIGVYVAWGQSAYTGSLGRNAVGTTLLLSLLLTVGLYLATRGRRRWVLAGGVVVQTLGLAVTFTRGAWIAAAGALITLVFLQRQRAVRGVVLVVAAGFLGVALVGSETFASHLFSSARVEENRGRIAIAISAVNILRDHPILGTGVNTFSMEYPSYQLRDADISPTQPYAHNIFLNTAAETGLLGVTLFAAIILGALLRGLQWHARAGHPRTAMISAAVLSAFVGLLINQQFDGTVISVHLGVGLWLLIGILAERPSHA